MKEVFLLRNLRPFFFLKDKYYSAVSFGYMPKTVRELISTKDWLIAALGWFPIISNGVYKYICTLFIS